MMLLPAPLMKLLRRWSAEQEASLIAMTERKTAGKRLAGYSRCERVEAKFLLLALTPFFLLMILDDWTWSRGIVWWTWLCVSCAWAALVMGMCFRAMWRVIRRSWRRK